MITYDIYVYVNIYIYIYIYIIVFPFLSRAFYKIYVIFAAIHPALMISLPFSDLRC